MPRLARSPLAPLLGQRVPLRGPARLLFNSYAKLSYRPRQAMTRVTTQAGDTFEVDLSSNLEWQLWAFGGFKHHFAGLFARLVQPGDRCVDVGANVGVHTVRLARLAGRDGEVIAIEPDPEVARRTERNIALNDVANVRLVRAAAGEGPGELRLYRPSPWDTNRARASLHRSDYLTGNAVPVPVVTVDELCQGEPVTLIKIDVEGHEEAVLHGAAATIARYAPSVVFEFDPDARTPFTWLAARGYALYRIRCGRHGLTGRTRLILDRLTEPPSEPGDLLAVAPALAGRLNPLLG